MTTEEKAKNLEIWTIFRKETYDKSIVLFGPITPQNLKKHQNYMKIAEKNWRKTQKELSF